MSLVHRQFGELVPERDQGFKSLTERGGLSRVWPKESGLRPLGLVLHRFKSCIHQLAFSVRRKSSQGILEGVCSSVRIEYRASNSGVPGSNPGISVGLVSLITTRALAFDMELGEDFTDSLSFIDGEWRS